MLGNSNFGFSGGGGGGGGGGNIGGGGTLNYVAMFSPNGTSIADSPIKIGDGVTRPLPTNTGTNSVAVGYNNTLSATVEDTYAIGYDLSYVGTGGFLFGFNMNIDGSSTTHGSGRIFSMGSDFTITGGSFCDAIINLSFASSITATSETRAVFLFGDSHVLNDFVTYSTLIGESCNFTRVDHVTVIGIFNSLTDVTYTYSFGESNAIDSSSSISNFGVGNTITTATNVVNVGNGNFISGIDNSVIIGIGNTTTPASDQILIGISDNGIRVNNLGDVTIGTTTFDARVNIIGVDSGLNFALKVKNNNPSSLFEVRNDGLVGVGGVSPFTNYKFHIQTNLANNGLQVIGGGVGTLTLGTDSDTQSGVLRLRDQPAGTDGWVLRTIGDSYMIGLYNFGVGIASSTSRFHVQGIDATIANFSLKVDTNIGSPLLYVRNDGAVSVGIATALARFHNFGVIGGINQRLEPVNGVTEDVTGATVATTNGTTTTLQTIAIPTDTGLLIECRVTCKKTGGAGTGTTGDVNGYIRVIKAKNVGGVVTIGVIQSSFTSEDITSFNATFVVSGTNILLQVVGSVNNNVTWNVIARTEKVS